MSLNRPCFQTFDYNKYIEKLQEIYTKYGPNYDNDYSGALRDGVESPQKTVVFDLLNPIKYQIITSFKDSLEGIKNILFFICVCVLSCTIYVFIFTYKYIRLTWRNHKIKHDSRYIHIMNHVNES